MKKTILTTLILLFITNYVSSQGFSKVMPQDWISTLSQNKAFNNLKHENIEGSPYISEKFQVAKISGIDGDIMVRYDQESDQIEVQDKDEKIFILPKEKDLNSITIESINYKLRLVVYPDKNQEVSGYLHEVVQSNQIALLRRDKMTIRPEKQPKTTFESYSPARFINSKKKYYLEKQDGKIIEMPNNKNQLQELYPNHKDELNDFFKNNSLNFKDETDLIKITNFISSI